MDLSLQQGYLNRGQGAIIPHYFQKHVFPNPWGYLIEPCCMAHTVYYTVMQLISTVWKYRTVFCFDPPTQSTIYIHTQKAKKKQGL